MVTPLPFAEDVRVDLEDGARVVAEVLGDFVDGRRGVWVNYRTNNVAVTDLYLRLGFAIGEFSD